MSDWEHWMRHMHQPWCCHQPLEGDNDALAAENCLLCKYDCCFSDTDAFSWCIRLPELMQNLHECSYNQWIVLDSFSCTISQKIVQCFSQREMWLPKNQAVWELCHCYMALGCQIVKQYLLGKHLKPWPSFTNVDPEVFNFFFQCTSNGPHD